MYYNVHAFGNRSHLPPAPVTRMSYVLAHLLLANNGLSSKAGLIVINNRYHRPDTPNCVGHTPIVHLRLKDFREVGSLTTLIFGNRYRYNYTNSCCFRQDDEGEKSEKNGKICIAVPRELASYTKRVSLTALRRQFRRRRSARKELS